MSQSRSCRGDGAVRLSVETAFSTEFRKGGQQYLALGRAGSLSKLSHKILKGVRKND